jgi:hypothetical protein
VGTGKERTVSEEQEGYETEGQESFRQWCIVELMGRQVIAGLVTEQVIGGSTLLRVDVPEVDGRPAFTRFYGGSAIYAITPVSEEVALAALRRFRPQPVTVFTPRLLGPPDEDGGF